MATPAAFLPQHQRQPQQLQQPQQPHQLQQPQQPQQLQQQLQQQQPFQPQQLQQTQIHHVQPALAYQSCCGPYPKILAGKPRSAAYGVGIAVLLTGIASFIIGIVGFFNNTANVYYYHYGSGSYAHIINYSVYIGANIWCGIFYILCGIFGVTSRKNSSNPHLMNAYFAFAIISLILSLPHFGINIGYMVSNRFGYSLGPTIWFNIVSLIFSILEFSLSIAAIVILGNNIYCKSMNGTDVTAVHYQGTNQVVTIQQFPNQYPPQVVPQYPSQPVMAFQPSLPVYVQSTPTGQYMMNTNQTAINQEKPILPPYSNLPNQQGPADQS